MSPDGTRFVIVDEPNAVHQTLHLVTDWYARLGNATNAGDRTR
jgi:hypothetical protein